ncbi:MAG: hypothetical protein Q9O24_10940 [Gammaproteobacteria bacterium]|nr:hypothetical protein [Gammaproteobacteria bacterium]
MKARMNKGISRFGLLKGVLLGLLLQSVAQAGSTYITHVDNLGQGGIPTPDGDLLFTSLPLGSGGIAVYKAGTLINQPLTQQAGPVEFNINMTGALPQQSVYLTVTAFDVDEEGLILPALIPPELNVVEFNGLSVGNGIALAAYPLIEQGSYLTGFNNDYSTTVFALPLNRVVSGNNSVVIRPSQVSGSNGAVMVTVAHLLIDGGEAVQGQISAVDALSANVTATTVDLQLQSSLNVVQAGNYKLDYSIIDPNGNSPVTLSIPFTSVANAQFTRAIDSISFVYDAALVGDYTLYAQLFYTSGTAAVPVGVPLQQSVQALQFRPNDIDADGLLDSEELLLGTDLYNPDSDGDGVNDGIEVGLNYPATPAIDTDGDGAIDALESDRVDDDGDTLSNQQDSDNADPCVPNLSSLACLALNDDDGDGLRNGDEVALGTDPNNADSDGDGLNDAVEVGGNVAAPLDSDGDGVIDALESKRNDADQDGVSDQLDPANNDACNPDASVALCDADGDGLNNGQERLLGTDPNRADSDGDGLHDGLEVGANSSMPIDSDGDGLIDALESNSVDSDGDGLVDALESNIFDADGDGVVDQYDPSNLNACLPSNVVAACDSDGDGLSDGFELQWGLNPTLNDSDGDGILDLIEVGAALIPLDGDGDGVLDALESSLLDADGDGVVDVLDTNNANACLPSNMVAACDSDNDGLSDGFELQWGLNPNLSDSDGDGLADLLEVGNVASPQDSNGNGVIDALESNQQDSDGDGVVDALDSSKSNACLPSNLVAACDSDGDGLSDGIELQLGTDPTNKDSDGDGVSDFIEVGLVSSPSNVDGDLRISALESALLDSDQDGLNDQLDSANLDPCAPDRSSVACLNVSRLGTDQFGAGSQGPLPLLVLFLLLLVRGRRLRFYR